MKKLLFSFILILFVNMVHTQDMSMVSNSLYEQLIDSPHEKVDVIIMLNEQVDYQELILEIQEAGNTRKTKQQSALVQMRDMAKTTQPKLRVWLKENMNLSDNEIRSYWIVNAIGVDANWEEVLQIAENPDVRYISGQPEFKPDLAEQMKPFPNTKSPGQHEPGHDLINAPALWAMGYTGYGTKAYIYDTGIDIEHPALRSNFSFHNNPMEISWKGKSEEPYTCTDHGSHVAGTILGLDRVRNDTIGVAFNAQYMMSPQFTSCGARRQDNLVTWQWVLDPDEDPETTDELANVVNMSGGSQVTDTVCGNFLIESLLMGLQFGDMGAIFSAGNSGPGPRTNGSPALHNLDLVHAFSVGNINANNLIINSSSSRGPSHCSSPEESLMIKPEVSAPGTLVRSSVRDGNYSNFTGTSMAAPHTSGAFLLLKEAFPFLSERDLLEALYFSAVDYGEPGEDNVYGNGVIDVLAAFNWLVNQGYEAVPPLSRKYDLIAVDMSLDQLIYCSELPKINVLFENGGTDTIYSVRLNFSEENGTLDSFTESWNGVLAPDEIAEMAFELPVETTIGKHDLLMSLELMDNQEEVRLLNNQFKKRFRVFDQPAFAIGIAHEASNLVCSGSRVLLTAESTVNEDQEVVWFEDDLEGNPVSVSQSYLTPILDEDKRYFAALETNYRMGMQLDNANIDIGDDAFGGLVFDVERPMRIERFKVNVATAGGRYIQLFDPFGEIIRSKLISLPAGEKTIEVNWNIEEPGKGFRIVVTTGKPLAHATDSPEFPYTVEGVMSIQSGLYDGEVNNQYYYFFDWEVSALHPCGEKAIDLYVSENDTIAPVEILAESDTVYLSDGGLINLEASDNSFTNYEWDLDNGSMLIGQSIVAEFFDAGTYVVRLHATSASECNTNTARVIAVLDDLKTGVNDPKKKEINIEVFPNPASHKIYIRVNADVEFTDLIDVSIYDLLGKNVLNKSNVGVSDLIELDVHSLAAGQYVIHLLGQNVMIIVHD